ncbi:ribonuclease H-like domain-containing protein [Lanmaoa asiatica]|nr:ribonuclease H-like domain-containing protein [Lanmaoa asiatica]
MLALRRALNDPERCQDVIAHRLIFCEVVQSLPTEDLLLDCWCCNRFLAYCCACTERQRQAEAARRQCRSLLGDDDDDEPPPRPCHYYKIAFVDGACLENGRDGATAGIGIAIGRNPMTMHWAIPIGDDIDPSFIRTSQRAELLAAIHGIRKLAEFEDRSKDKLGKAKEVHRDSDGKITWVITSDSEYVVLGMTEWVPAWKSNGWRNSSRKRPKNLDLFQTLDATVMRYEQEYGVRIAFWRISRIYNELADELAEFAAKGHTVEPLQFESMHSLSDEMVTD